MHVLVVPFLMALIVCGLYAMAKPRARKDY